MGFGYPLGVDLPGEARGLIPNAEFYDRHYKRGWNGQTVVTISIGQGEVLATPLQIANLGATIANRGYFITPHVVKKIEGEPLDSLYTTRRYTDAPQWAYEKVAEGMRSAALGGTCKALAGLPFAACGKTGTAQNKGHSKNVVNAAKLAKAAGVKVLALTGEGESALSSLADCAIRVGER